MSGFEDLRRKSEASQAARAEASRRPNEPVDPVAFHRELLLRWGKTQFPPALGELKRLIQSGAVESPPVANNSSFSPKFFDLKLADPIQSSPMSPTTDLNRIYFSMATVYLGSTGNYTGPDSDLLSMSDSQYRYSLSAAYSFAISMDGVSNVRIGYGGRRYTTWYGRVMRESKGEILMLDQSKLDNRAEIESSLAQAVILPSLSVNEVRSGVPGWKPSPPPDSRSEGYQPGM